MNNKIQLITEINSLFHRALNLVHNNYILLCILFLFNTNSASAQTFNIVLGRPTQKSITVSIQFSANTDYFIQYGTDEKNLISSSDTFSFTSNYPDEILLNNLLPNQLYYYQVRYKYPTDLTYKTSNTYKFQTQRNSGQSFNFTIEADEHLYDKKGIKSLYEICLKNQASSNPDFMLSLGDIFGDDHNPFTITESEIDNLHEYYRPILGNITHSIPFYVCLGNHEGEMDYYLNKNPGNNLAHYATKYRQLYYPNPFPNEFYSGNTEKEGWGIEYPENYYSWNWGNALFVVLDVYRDQCDTSAKPGGWTWTLGEPQYKWLESVLTKDISKFKFVFAHHISGQGRGGINQAKLFEWGGKDSKGQYTFSNKRPGWSKPIHQLFVDNGVNIFFQGHDHVFAHEVLDGVIYQALPMPSDTTYMIGKLANADAYTQDTLSGSGHLKVSVSDQCVTIAYISAFLPKDTSIQGQKNNQTVFEYTIGKCSNASFTNFKTSNQSISVFPNPSSTFININLKLPQISNLKPKYDVMDFQGKIIKTSLENQLDISDLNNGIYIIQATINNFTYQTKFIKIQ